MRDVSFDEIRLVFESYREGAMTEEKMAKLWNCLLDDLRMLGETEKTEVAGKLNQ